MTFCCHTPAAKPSDTTTLTLALAGNPNSGKTTIFNALTGLRQKIANYPGVTVERKTGRCKLPDGRWIEVVDLPGTYSLVSRSPDEVVAMEVLRGLRPDTRLPDAVVVVVDASNLQRNLYLVSQLIELGRPLVVALNMMDVAARRGIHVSPESLQQQLGVPVVPVVGHKRQGIDQLKLAISQARIAPMPDWPLPEPMKEELVIVGGGLAILDSESSPDNDPIPRSWIRPSTNGNPLDRYTALAERLLIGDSAPDVANVARHEPVASLLTSASARMGQLGIDPMQADIEAHYRWIERVASSASASAEELAAMGNTAQPGAVADAPRRGWTDRLDSVLIHKVWGLSIFALVMAMLFVTIFWIADPIMGAAEDGITALGDLVAGRMSAGPLRDLVVDGVFAGVGGVVVFVPQIALLFLFLAILEDSGYLARAAFLMDRLLARVGLHGKSFIPLLSSFACAIPGIMATRTIENRRDRLATIFIAPFMSCSARLPVYYLLIGTLFATLSVWARAGIMFSLYLLGILAAVFTAFIFKRTFLKSAPAAFILEMPSYKLPQVAQVGRVVLVNTWQFLARAGTIIFALSIVLWALTYYPRLPADRVGEISTAAETAFVQQHASGNEYDSVADYEAARDGAVEQALAGEQLACSVAGRIGHQLEPVIKPLGYDWKMGVGLLGAFAAREIFVSTMGIIYSVGSVDDATSPLAQAMLADRYPNGMAVWTPLVGISLLVWFVLAMQCMSTLAVVRRETGSWRWPVLMLLYMNALAYVVALTIYQLGQLFLGR